MSSYTTPWDANAFRRASNERSVMVAEPAIAGRRTLFVAAVSFHRDDGHEEEHTGHVVAPIGILAAGYHAPLAFALPIIAVVVIVRVLVSKSRGRPALAGRIVVRCSRGHVFTTNWSSLGSFTSIRLGYARFQRCSVGHHWGLVRPVNDSDLTDEERRLVERES